MRTMTVSISPQQAETIEKAVASGDYATNSEVVRDALRLWEERRQRREAEIGRLKAAYDEGLASGEPQELDVERFLAEMNEQFESQRKRKAG